MIKKFKGVYPSSDGAHSISYTVYFPEGEIKAVVQISHGMCEYFGRYKDIAGFLPDIHGAQEDKD